LLLTEISFSWNSKGQWARNQTGIAIKRIKESSEQVVVVVNDITSALAEQTIASNEIAAQVERVAQMTEENSAAIIQTENSARNLQELANNMWTEVIRFKI
jgi:methyl-accepting chemotaxis protein